MSNQEINTDPLVKPRLLVHSDIGNEPDDQQSLVRLVTYLNEIDLEGLIPTTSMWQSWKINPHLMERVINAYGGTPRDNLMKHTGNYYPTRDELLSLIKPGSIKYGMAGVGEGHDSEGSEWTIQVVDKPDPRPIWITLWGGANCLAQALWKIRNTRSQKELDDFIKKIRVYSHQDQDDSAPWIRKEFPNLFYVASPSPEVPSPQKRFIRKGNRYRAPINLLRFSMKVLKDLRKVTWVGISGELHYKFKGGPYSKIITNKWLKVNIRRNHGPLGEVYPRTIFAMEGDTVTFLWLIRSGLRSSQSPTYGGWGGRYELYTPKGESRPIYSDVEDTVVVGDGLGELKGDKKGIYVSNQATIWRWREAYQYDFAARMDWASTPNYEDANHPPSVVIHGELNRSVKGTEEIILDATGTSDPDGNNLSFYWFHYREAGSYEGTVIIEDPTSLKTSMSFKDPNKKGIIHIILQVKDDGNPCLFRYARIIINVY